MINFTSIPDKLKYPPHLRARLSTLHSSVITYVSTHFRRTYKYRKHVLDTMNSLSLILISGDTLPAEWSESNPLMNLPILDDSLCKAALGDIYLMDKNITWDLEETIIEDTVTSPITSATEISNPQKAENNLSSLDKLRSAEGLDVKRVPVKSVDKLTNKEDLYIKPPTVPQFDTSRPWAEGIIGGEKYVIYTTLPEIPKKQNEISVTTDISKMTQLDLVCLFPNHFIRTRSSVMYEQIPGIEYDPELGLILPVDGFTSAQIRDNIVKYPHLFRLTRLVDGEIVSLYTTIEIDGELKRTSDIWDSLPESKVIPRSSEFVKEYVARRYLLERDILGIHHKYPMFGSLDPFLTLFTTPEGYEKFGYFDAPELAKHCVKSRVNYKRTRNPVLRRLTNA